LFVKRVLERTKIILSNLSKLLRTKNTMNKIIEESLEAQLKIAKNLETSLRKRHQSLLNEYIHPSREM